MEKSFDLQNQGAINISMELNKIIKIKVSEGNLNYENKFTLENLKLKNKYFQVCELNEIFLIINKSIENKKITVNKISNTFALKISIEFYNNMTEAEFILINKEENKDRNMDR